MKQFQNTILIFLIMTLITSCSPFSAQEQDGNKPSEKTLLEVSYLTDQAKEQASEITDTPAPTFTPLPSATRIPSATFIPSSTPTDTPTVTQVIIPTTTKVYVPPVSNGGSCGASLNTGFEAQVIALINQERANNGLSGLASSGALGNSSRNHSLDMACNNFVDHIGSNGSTFGSRISLAGFSFSTAGENIGAGQGSPADVVAAWMASEGHRVNILNASFTHIGVGYANYSGSSYQSYWTADFGRH